MNSQPVKASKCEGIRQKIVETYPWIGDYIDDIWPKKAKVLSIKPKGVSHIHFYSIDEEIKFMELKGKPILPMLRVLHAYPLMMKMQTCDKGAIKHIFSGSNIMAPGLTSEGGNLVDCEAGEAVAIMAEGKEHAMGIGLMNMSSDEIKSEGKGEAIELIFFMNDAVWKDLE